MSPLLVARSRSSDGTPSCFPCQRSVSAIERRQARLDGIRGDRGCVCEACIGPNKMIVCGAIKRFCVRFVFLRRQTFTERQSWVRSKKNFAPRHRVKQFSCPAALINGVGTNASFPCASVGRGWYTGIFTVCSVAKNRRCSATSWTRYLHKIAKQREHEHHVPLANPGELLGRLLLRLLAV